MKIDDLRATVIATPGKFLDFRGMGPWRSAGLIQQWEGLTNSLLNAVHPMLYFWTYKMLRLMSSSFGQKRHQSKGN